VGIGTFSGSRRYKFDGWGPILGDFGSGFQLAVDLVRFLAREFDHERVPPIFQDVLSIEPQINDLESLQLWFDGLYLAYPDAWRIRFARLASAVTTAADRSDPDPDARRLVEESALGMAKTIEIAFQRHELDTEGLPLVFQGGMFEHSELYRQTVINQVARKCGTVGAPGRFRTAAGALLMALAHAPTLPPDDVLGAAVESLDNARVAEKHLISYF
jgi:N-acetylglucosamine kinase-like BadF-type ATPase